MSCFSDVAILEGMRREKAINGYGSRAIEENEESVAPWNLLILAAVVVLAVVVLATFPSSSSPSSKSTPTPSKG